MRYALPLLFALLALGCGGGTTTTKEFKSVGGAISTTAPAPTTAAMEK